jgi:hypothetical protein
VQRIYEGTKTDHEKMNFMRALARLCTGLSQLRDGVHASGDFTDLFVICASHKAEIAQQ